MPIWLWHLGPANAASGGVYVLALAASGLSAMKQYKMPGLLVTLPFSIFVTHVSYGIASVCGWVRSKMEAANLLPNRTGSIVCSVTIKQR